MNVNELMIGDWVDRFNKPPYYKVVAVNNATTEVHISETGEDDDTKRIVWDDKLDPIPLTDEILNKNGFEEGWTECFKGYNLMKSSKGYYSIEDHCLIKLRYVHELQHALKLCGIDKEIIL